MLINTDLFREDAKHFLKHGYYTAAPLGTPDWEDYWDEQTNRCLYGYSVGGMRITGYHYFYLNFCRILRVPDEVKEVGGKRGITIEELFPAFWDGDYNYFWACEIARRGITPYWEDVDKREIESLVTDKEERLKIYNALALDIDIRPEDLEGGKHIAVLKARGKGYSYKAGAILAANFNLRDHSKNYAMASDKTYLTEDGVLNKTWENIYFLNDNTAWAQPLLIDRIMHKRCGYKKVVGGKEVESGRLNEVIGVTTKNDPDKARGKRGDVIFFEEAGKFPGLLKAWEVCRPSVEQGIYTRGIMIAYGTGGTEDANYEGLEELFYNPEANNCIAINNQWDEGASGRWCSFFVPAWQNWEGMMDRDGNSDREAAYQYHMDQRALRRTSQDPRALEQYICENPFNPREATLNVSDNIFPTAELIAQRDYVETHGLSRMFSNGHLVYHGDSIKFVPDPNARPIRSFPLHKGEDPTGCVRILESPFVDADGNTPNDLYVIALDPYAKDGQNVDSPSLGAAFVFKNPSPVSPTFGECIVASYIGRPILQEDFYDNLFTLAEYYNCRVAFEATRGESVIAYARKHRLIHRLEPEPTLISRKKTIWGKSSIRRALGYGIPMSPARKNTGQVYVRDWLNKTVALLADGTRKKILHYIYDTAILDELIKYNDDGNFDRVDAIIIAMFSLKELEQRPVERTKQNSIMEFFDREVFV